MSKLTMLLSVALFSLSTACGTGATMRDPSVAGFGGGGGPAGFAPPPVANSPGSVAEPKVTTGNVHENHHGFDSGFHARCHRCD